MQTEPSNQPSDPLASVTWFLGAHSGALMTRKRSWYEPKICHGLLQGHEWTAVEVIVVNQADAQKGYRIGNFGMN